MKKCSYCGKEYPDDDAVCPLDQGSLVSVTTSSTPTVPPPKPTQAKAEKLAQNAFVLGIASILCGITAIPAIIQSIKALVCIRKDGASKAASRKAVFSLVFSCCTFAFLVFMVVSPFYAAREMADDINCISHMKELAVTIRLYEEDNNDTFPAAGRWCDALQSTNTAMFRCPNAPKKQRCSYAMNAKLGGVKDRGQIPEDTVMLFESDAGWNAAGGPEIATARHVNTLLHVAFVNGLVDYVQFTNIGKLRWEPSTNSPAGLAK
jgi:hypothetical protein